MIKQQFFTFARIYLVAGNAKRHESRLLIKNAFAGNSAWRVVVTQQSALHFLSAATPVCSLEMAARCSVSRCQRNWLDNKMHTTWCTSIKAAGAHCWTYLRGSYFSQCEMHTALAGSRISQLCVHPHKTLRINLRYYYSRRGAIFAASLLLCDVFWQRTLDSLNSPTHTNKLKRNINTLYHQRREKLIFWLNLMPLWPQSTILGKIEAPWRRQPADWNLR